MRLFGEAQTIVLTSTKLLAAQEIWRPASRWARAVKHKVRLANGENMIETPDGSRFGVQAANESLAVGWSLSLALVDESWAVSRPIVDGALVPTMSQSESPQLWLVSTAGDASSDLMRAYRQVATDTLDAPESTLIVEWSADPAADIDDHDVWQACTPNWDERRLEEMTDRRKTMLRDEFKSQYLNQWVESIKPKPGNPLLDEKTWEECRFPGLHIPNGGITAALEATAGQPAAIACAWRTGDGRIGLLGFTVASLDAAWARLGGMPGDTRFIVGLSWRADRRAQELNAVGMGQRETARALPILTDLVAARRMVWDGDQLGEQVRELRVLDSPSGAGSALVRSQLATQLARAAAWATMLVDQGEPEVSQIW